MNLITSRSTGTAGHFAIAIIAKPLGETAAQKVIAREKNTLL